MRSNYAFNGGSFPHITRRKKIGIPTKWKSWSCSILPGSWPEIYTGTDNRYKYFDDALYPAVCMHLELAMMVQSLQARRLLCPLPPCGERVVYVRLRDKMPKWLKFLKQSYKLCSMAWRCQHEGSIDIHYRIIVMVHKTTSNWNICQVLSMKERMGITAWPSRSFHNLRNKNRFVNNFWLRCNPYIQCAKVLASMYTVKMFLTCDSSWIESTENHCSYIFTRIITTLRLYWCQ